MAAGAAGGFGGFVGATANLINVRMQNDGELTLTLRRNYKNAMEGLLRVAREEGVTALWRGSCTGMVRAVLMTIAKLGFYDKQMLLLIPVLENTIFTLLLASSIAVKIVSVIVLLINSRTLHLCLLQAEAATTISLPVDVGKSEN